MTVFTYPEDLAAVERAIQSLEADERLLEAWGCHSVDLSIALGDLRSLRGRLLEARQELRDSLTQRTAYPLRAVR